MTENAVKPWSEWTNKIAGVEMASRDNAGGIMACQVSQKAPGSKFWNWHAQSFAPGEKGIPDARTGTCKTRDAAVAAAEEAASCMGWDVDGRMPFAVDAAFISANAAAAFHGYQVINDGDLWRLVCSTCWQQTAMDGPHTEKTSQPLRSGTRKVVLANAAKIAGPCPCDKEETQ